jgi:RNase P subunit RPR2
MAKRLQNLGLVQSTRRVEVQDVKRAHRKACDRCGSQPEGRRLHVKTGSGRAQKAEVMCAKCGSLFLDQSAREAWRACCRLVGDDVPVRFVDGELDEKREVFPLERRDDDKRSE